MRCGRVRTPRRGNDACAIPPKGMSVAMQLPFHGALFGYADSGPLLGTRRIRSAGDAGSWITSPYLSYFNASLPGHRSFSSVADHCAASAGWSSHASPETSEASLGGPSEARVQLSGCSSFRKLPACAFRISLNLTTRARAARVMNVRRPKLRITRRPFLDKGFLL